MNTEQINQLASKLSDLINDHSDLQVASDNYARTLLKISDNEAVDENEEYWNARSEFNLAVLTRVIVLNTPK